MVVGVEVDWLLAVFFCYSKLSKCSKGSGSRVWRF